MCSLGAAGQHEGRPRFDWGRAGAGAERWQILSPVRSRPGGVVGLNRRVRQTWRAGDATAARRSRKLPSPMGADEVLFNDKVMCLSNHRREAWIVDDRKKRDGEVANGEIGIAVFSAGKPPKGLKIEFSSQPGVQFTFWESNSIPRTIEGSCWRLPMRSRCTRRKARSSASRSSSFPTPARCCPLNCCTPR